MDKELELKLAALGTELKTHFEKANEEAKSTGTALESTKTAIESIKSQMGAIQTQLDAVDLKLNVSKFTNGGADQAKSLGEIFTESEEYKSAKGNDFLALRSNTGRIRTAIAEPFASRKASITTIGIGTGTSGVQMPFRLPGVTGLPSQQLRIRDLMTVRQMTTGNSFDFVQLLTRTNNASPQNEGQTKGESSYTWTSQSGTIKTLAHFTNISRQALDDIPWLRSSIDSELMYGLLLKEESEILSGDGTGQHLNGLTTQATAYNTGLNVSGDTYLDELRHAKLQARLIGLGTFAPDGIVVSPTDLAHIELIKDENGGANKGRYIIGDPRQGPTITLLWGLPVVESDSMPTGKFLVGSFGAGAELIDRMQAFVEISLEHSTNFTSNMATILCEERIGLAVRRPNAFIYGSFS